MSFKEGDRVKLYEVNDRGDRYYTDHWVITRVLDNDYYRLIHRVTGAVTWSTGDSLKLDIV